MIKLIFDASYDNMNDGMEKQVQHQIKDTTCNQDSFEGGGQTLCLDLADEKVAAVALYWRIITNVRADVKVIKKGSSPIMGTAHACLALAMCVHPGTSGPRSLCQVPVAAAWPRNICPSILK